jgi:hypothetical protein
MNGNILMTVTSYFFGLGMLVFMIRNGKAVVSALSGFWGAGTNVITGVGGINVGSGGY